MKIVLLADFHNDRSDKGTIALAKRIRELNPDLILMPGDMGHVAKKYSSDGSLLRTLGKPDGITIGELQRTAKNTLEAIIRLRKLEKA